MVFSPYSADESQNMYRAGLIAAIHIDVMFKRPVSMAAERNR